ncbi:hypothetical protein HMPREF3289_01030 [Pseudomonas sp. HMSC75E02]|uniref:hypothetical protein n=1 Tax=Pseudomonas sp. HMSC75E02 TaxID=1608908 RepID=UPI0008A9F661|nr:hypothetical protein [Pseudomonas sp. HMSC75E02]OHS09280.1 hypothetical protein HMPREF3289_01030 [Pseudomonas sp. HMSC75E02]
MDYYPQAVIAVAPTWALRTITLQLTREGEQTSASKLGRLVTRNLGALAYHVGAFESSNVLLASAIDGTQVIMVATDETFPPLAGARYLTISADTTLAIDLNDGAGSGGGSPATVQAQARVNGLPAERDVVVVERLLDGTWRSVGSGRTDTAGNALLELRVSPSGRLYAMSPDEWGVEFQPNMVVGVGATVRPSQMFGWLYRITEAGVLPAAEPEWWPGTTEASQPLGTARAVAVRYYRPQGLGPITVEVI